MRYLGGHLGALVSPLVDGQLDDTSAERAWAHIHTCSLCRRQVEHEGWVKTRLASVAEEGAPPPDLVGSLYGLGVGTPGGALRDPAAAWAAVQALERQGRARRRAGIAVAGAGSVSLAVLGLASLTGASLGIGGPAGQPSADVTTTVIAPVARVRGTLAADGLLQRRAESSPSTSPEVSARPRSR